MDTMNTSNDIMTNVTKNAASDTSILSALAAAPAEVYNLMPTSQTDTEIRFNASDIATTWTELENKILILRISSSYPFDGTRTVYLELDPGRWYNTFTVPNDNKMRTAVYIGFKNSSADSANVCRLLFDVDGYGMGA